jgi:hypothetical protein
MPPGYSIQNRQPRSGFSPAANDLGGGEWGRF